MKVCVNNEHGPNSSVKTAACSSNYYVLLLKSYLQVQEEEKEILVVLQQLSTYYFKNMEEYGSYIPSGVSYSGCQQQ